MENKMSWVKPGLWGLVIGGAMVAALGFGALGWVTGGAAKDMAKKAADTAVVAALVPICVLDFQAQPNAAAKLAELKELASYQRGKLIEEAGLATIPADTTPNSAVARACATELLKTAS